MLHKKRRRTRKTAVLQKKEELLESDVSFDDDELLVKINRTEIKNSLSSSSQLHSSSKSNPGIIAEMSEESLQQTWSRRWKWSLGHSLWQTISPLRRSTKNLFTLGLLLVFIFSCTVGVHGQPPPPPAGFLDFDNLPVTRFSCEGKVIGGYYADVETGCQMFHVCTLGQKDEVQDIKFLCLNGTVFDQETRVCERVDEVDCSKAEQFFDLNLDLYAPHVATPKPPEQDLEEEDANISAVSTSKPTSPSTTTTRTTTTTTKRPTTTTPKSLPTTTQSSSRTRLTTPQPPEATTTKGYSSFNYYLKTPHSHVASGYNSQSRQSYIFNHKPSIEDESEDNSGSYTVSENTARKIPSGPKTIVYTPSTSSSTARPSNNNNNRAPSRNSVSQTSSTTAAPVKLEEIDEQYADEYYEDELPLEYDVSSSTAGSQQSNSKQSSYELEPRSSSSKSSSNSYSAQPQTQFRGKSSQNSYDFRDGRSTGSSKSSSSKGSKGGSESVSVAVSRSKATISPPVITRPPTTKHKVINVTTTTTTEEPYYYDDDYPEDEVVQQQQQPAIIVRGTSSSTSRSAGQNGDNGRNTKSSSNTKSVTATSDTSGPSAPSGPTGSEGDNAEYYDDGGDGQALNVNEHHFTHVDVPRIPFAKPNVPRVLVTNGKPFLPRLRRQSIHHKVLDHSAKDSVPMVDISSLWDSLTTHEDYNDPHSHKHAQNIPLSSDSSLRIRRNIPRSLSKVNLGVNRASSSVINSKVSTHNDNNKISGVTKR